MRSLGAGLLAALLNTALLLPVAWLAGGPSRLATGEMALLVLAGAFAFVEAALQRQRGQVERTDPAVAATGLTILAVFASAIGFGTAAPLWLLTAGIASALLGIGLRAAAIHALDGRFVTQVMAGPDRDLVTDGPYRWVRHPSEVGLLCLALGAAGVMGSPVALLLWVVFLVPLVLVRVAREDRQLRNRFGAAYESYRRRVPALLPTRLLFS